MLNPLDRWQWEDLGYRTGYIATAQLPLIFILAGKNNMIGVLTGSSYERLNWIHRWISRILLLTVTMHMVFWFRDWAPYDFITVKLKTDSITKRGFSAWCILVWILFSSFAPIRKWNYEFFVVQHLITLIGFMVAVFLHLKPYGMQYWVYISLAFGVVDRAVRFLSILYVNFHKPNKQTGSRLWGCNAILEPLPGSVTKITISNPPIHWTPGQHVFLSCHGIMPLQSHPFTISSLPNDGNLEFFIKAEKGGTHRMYRHAQKYHQLSGGVRFERFIIDGPYGRIRPLNQFDSVVFFAGSTGITYTLPLFRDLVQKLATPSHHSSGFDLQGPSAAVTQHIRFVWVIKSRTQLAWCATELSKAASEISHLRSEDKAIELHISIYTTCDELLETSNNSQPQRRGSIASSVGETASIIDEKGFEKTDNDDVHVKIKSLSPDDLTPVVTSTTKACGPDGTCCCATTILSEDENAISPCNCNCTPSSEPTSSSAASLNSIEKRPKLSSQSTLSALHPAISLLSGRPHPRTLIRKTLEQALGESAVVVCGPKGLVDDVRQSVVGLSDERAVHKGTGAQGVFLHAECFGY